MTLVSAAVLAVDLVKHPSGAQVADAADRVLALTPADLQAVAEELPGDLDERASLEADRAVVLAAARETLDADEALRAAGDVLARLADEPTPRSPALRAVRESLEAAPLTTVDGLLDLLRAHLQDTHPLSDVDSREAALDVVAAAWVGNSRGATVLASAERLRGPSTRALAPVPPPLDDPYGGHAADLRDLLDRVGRLPTSAWERVHSAHRGRGRGLSWSTTLHQACAAAVQGDRVVAVARAQLSGARAVRLSGVSTGALAGSAAMSVAAAVQAVAVLDLLDVETARRLMAPWLAGSGAL